MTTGLTLSDLDVCLDVLLGEFRMLHAEAPLPDRDDVEILIDVVKRTWRLATITYFELRCDSTLSPGTVMLLEEAFLELDELYRDCHEAVLRYERLINVLADWYARDNFGKSAYSRLVPLMA
ncbi:MAG: hypothetical protein ACM3KF_04460 [Acidobacteriota bacterium]